MAAKTARRKINPKIGANNINQFKFKNPKILARKITKVKNMTKITYLRIF